MRIIPQKYPGQTTISSTEEVGTHLLTFGGAAIFLGILTVNFFSIPVSQMEGLIMLKAFLLFFCSTSLIIMLFFTAGSLRNLYQICQLDRHGLTTSGVITGIWQTDEEDNCCFVKYQYDENYQAIGLVKPATRRLLNVGDPIKVRYLPEFPHIARASFEPASAS